MCVGMSMIPVCLCGTSFCEYNNYVWREYDLLRVYFPYVSRNSECVIFYGLLSEGHFLHCQYFLPHEGYGKADCVYVCLFQLYITAQELQCDKN